MSRAAFARRERTIANELWTLHGRASALTSLLWPCTQRTPPLTRSVRRMSKISSDPRIDPRIKALFCAVALAQAS
jgi:hypothetical protein